MLDNTGLALEKDKQIDIAIEELLSEDDEESHENKGAESELISKLTLNQFKRNSEIIIPTNELQEAKSSVNKNDSELILEKFSS